MTDLYTAATLKALRQRWQAEGILHGEGASATDLAAFEARYGVVLPQDVRAYFATVNGTTPGAYGMADRDLLGFWQLHEVRTFAEKGIGDDPDVERSFVFADHSLWVYAFALRLSTDGNAPAPVVVDLGSPHYRVTESLTEFFDRYLSGDTDVIYPGPPSGPARAAV
jgi:SMI1 / KNR4 family (SUKH-1)